jgi:hypothetical protein
MKEDMRVLIAMEDVNAKDDMSGNIEE